MYRWRYFCYQTLWYTLGALEKSMGACRFIGPTGQQVWKVFMKTGYYIDKITQNFNFICNCSVEKTCAIGSATGNRMDEYYLVVPVSSGQWGEVSKLLVFNSCRLALRVDHLRIYSGKLFIIIKLLFVSHFDRVMSLWSIWQLSVLATPIPLF